MESIFEKIYKTIQICYSGNNLNVADIVRELIESLSFQDNINEEIIQITNQILDAFEVEDFVSIGDYLQYGMLPLLSNETCSEKVFFPYSKLIPKVQEKVFYLASLMDEEPLICVRIKDRIYKINSFFSVKNETEFFLKGLNIKKTTPVVCLFGIGTGLLADKILDMISKDAKLIIFEPDKAIFDYIMKSGEGDEADPLEKRIKNRLEKIVNDVRVTLFIENECSRSFSRILDDSIDYSGLVGLVHIVHNGYSKAYSKDCLRFYREINEFKERIITNKNTEFYFRDEYVFNSFKNIKYCKNINIFSELTKIVPRDIPAVIVSAGPSLDKNIEDLRLVKGHFFIIAVDTAVKYLLKKDILPDITLTIDPEKPLDYFSDIRAASIPCIFANNANSEILKILQGRRFLLDGKKEYLELLLNSMGIETAPLQGFGGSVATAAFAVLYYLKVKNIILVGQDLAFRGNSSHAGSIDDGFSEGVTFVEGIDGEKVRTRFDWLNYLKWFEDAIKVINAEGADIRVIDATEGGAKIHGSIIMPLKEVIDSFKETDGRLMKFDFEDKLKELPFLIDEDRYKALCEKHKNIVRNIRNIKNDSNEAALMCDQLITGIQNGTVSSSYFIKQNKKIRTIRERIEKSPMYNIISRYSDNFTINESTRLELQDGTNEDIQINLLKVLKLSFNTYSEVSEKIYKIAKEYVKNL